MSDRDKEAWRRQQAKAAKAEEDMEWMEAVLRVGNNATYEAWYTQLRAIKGWSRPTFKRRLRSFKKWHPELTGGRWQGDPYSLPTPPTAAMTERVALLRTWLTPSRHFISSQDVRLVEPGPIRGQAGPARFREVGSARLRDLPPSGEDLLAKARAYVKPTKME
jgi:hypothetical protein